MSTTRDSASLVPADGAFDARVHASFGRQRVMSTIGATLEEVRAGTVVIRLPFRDDLTQQHGFIHAGIIGTVADSACGYAAYSLMPAEAAVLTIEYKLNLLAPAKGAAFLARGQVVRAGRTITVCRADVIALEHATADDGTIVATMLGTIMTIRGRDGIAG